MLDVRRTFVALHPTTRTYLAEKATSEPLPSRLQELVERMREVEPVLRGWNEKENRKALPSDSRHPQGQKSSSR